MLPLRAMSQEVSDTVVVRSPIHFETETVVSKTGKPVVNVYAVVNGVYYDSNKTSVKKYNTIRRLGGIPTVVLITTGKTKKRVVVL